MKVVPVHFVFETVLHHTTCSSVLLDRLMQLHLNQIMVHLHHQLSTDQLKLLTVEIHGNTTVQAVSRIGFIHRLLELLQLRFVAHFRLRGLLFMPLFGFNLFGMRFVTIYLI
jgi:hypothetical protein